MKKEAPNEYRFQDGFFKSTDADGMKGMFRIPLNGDTILASVNVAKNETDHVTISTMTRKPTEDEIEHIKRVFWDDNELSDVFVFDPKPMLPPNMRLNPNTVHLKKRKNDWKL